MKSDSIFLIVVAAGVFLASLGYGFIAPEGGDKDVFVHISVLQKCGIETLNENDQVEFETEMHNGREGVGNINLI